MSVKVENLLSLEQQVASVEADALAEEQGYAKENYGRLRSELEAIHVPFPDVTPYSTGMDYSDISDVQYKKKQNRPYWDAQELISRYVNNGKLYCGHLRSVEGIDFFIIDSQELPSRTLAGTNHSVRLINVDDSNYADIRRMWQFPSPRSNVSFSRNIVMHDYAVQEVDVKFDRSNQLLSGITDSYLRKALVRNKGKSGVQSIIQTIQRKQDDIRMLPASKSFIVQGCAGSGKTMVLLHRLRYLLYNKAIDTDAYLFLAPSNSFRAFVKDACAEFRINYRNVVPIQSYYQMVMGKPLNDNAADVSELVFDSKYLARIYSKDFIRECYRHLFTLFAEQATALTDLCEACLARLVAEEEQRLEDEITKTKNVAVERVRALTERVLDFLPVQLEDYDSIPGVCDALADAYYAAKENYDQNVEPEYEVVISPDDERIIRHPILQQLSGEIIAQQEKVRKALIFTVSSHRKKLAALEAQYQSIYRDVEQALIEEDRRSYAERAVQLSYVFEGVTIAEIEQILNALQDMGASIEEHLAELEKDQECMQANLNDEHKEGIYYLQNMIETSGAIMAQCHGTIKELNPSWQYFRENIGTGRVLLNCFSPYFTAKEKAYVKEKLRLFANRTDLQLEAYLNTLLFNACKRTIKQEFGIKICDLYKHYWYLALYCYYLTRSRTGKPYTYLFVDEAQDLSPSELELIYRLNTYVEESDNIPAIVDYVEDGNGRMVLAGRDKKQMTHRLHTPRMNVFGDINQMITEHGIRSWDDVRFISEIYELNENFRNTNQIVDFCNMHLPVSMQSVGVDMDTVRSFDSLASLEDDELRSIKVGGVYVVKDDYAVADLTYLLRTMGISEYSIYTVKAVKGLEFREVIVFDRDMSANEKYIAYTRALAKLTVIKELPHVTDDSVPLYVEGEDTEELE